MKLRNKALIGMSLFAAACGSNDDTNPNTPDGKTGTIVGRLTLDGSGSGSATGASAFSLGDDGGLTLVGSGSVASDGSFRIEEVEGDGPFIVQLTGSSSSELVGSVIVPEDVDGEEIETLPVSAETTAEAEALIELVAGEADADDVDTIALMSWVDGELAASSESGDIAAAFASAQEGWLRVTGESAEAVEAAKLEAWAELTASLSSTSADAEQAWSDFHARVAGDIAATIDASESEQANAQAAASVLFEAAFEGASDGAQHAAARIAATLSANADFAAQREALEGQAASFTADLEAAYAAFFQSIDDADTEEQMQSAWLTLNGELRAMIESSGASADDLEEAFTAAAEAHASLTASLEAAFSGEGDGAEAVANAYAAFRADIAAAFANVQGEWSDFASEATAQLTGHVSVLFDIDLSDILDLDGEPTDPTELGLDIVGSFVASLGSDLEAVLVSIDAEGALHAVATGTADNGTYTFEGVGELTGTLMVELQDESDNIVGAVVLDAFAQTEGEYTAESITTETTAEAQVLVERLADGEDQIDFSAIEARIDGAIAAAATDGEGDDADIDALATATLAAEHTQASAALTFALVVEAIRGEGEAVSEASEARSRIEAALALDAAVQSAFEGTSFEARATEIHAAVIGFISASDEASDGDELDAAASAFVDAVLVIQSAINGDELSLDLVSQAAIATAFEGSFAAGQVFEGALTVAFTASGASDWSGFASGTGAAQSTFDGSLATALSLSSVSLSDADHAAVSTLAAHLAGSFSGSFDGTFAQ